MTDLLLVVVVGISVLSLAALFQVIRQQGRLLLRIDALETHLMGEATAPAGFGLEVGAQPDPFELPDLDGHPVRLADFRGKRLLLVNWSPTCGFCDLIVRELAELQPSLRKRKIELVLASYGDARSNRELVAEHGLECSILIQDGRAIDAFAGVGTPAAYLIDEDGRVARPLAVGAEEVPELARQIATRTKLSSERDLSASRIERNGLPAGSPAPTFSLPDLRGRTVSLEDYRGRRVLLVFSDPDCGPCDALAPDLVRFEREHRDNNLAVVMVGRGNPEENRRKAKQHRFVFPVVVQDRWKLSTQYGIFATPVAFLIDEQGVIARDVAVGSDQILALAHELVPM